MAWGDEKCMWCEKLVNSDLISACQCHDRLTYRKEPEAPASAMRMYYDAEPRHTTWQLALQAFEKLPAQERRAWHAKADADRARFEREKMEYNDNLALDEELVTDKEEEGRMECGNAVAEIRQALQRRRCEQQWARYRRDHWAFSTHSRSTDVGPAAFHRFRDLPTEIRIQIYTHLFGARGRLEVLKQWQLEYESADVDPDLRFTHLQPLDTRILAASRQIHAEALEVLYSTRCFTVDVARASVLPLFIRNPTGVVLPRPTSKIKRWHIRITFTDVLHKEFVLPQLHLVHDALKDCIALDEVRFSWISVPYYWSEVPGLRHEHDGMLSLFKDIKGVKKVVFTEGFNGEVKGGVRQWQYQLLGGWDNIHLASEDVRREVKANMESPR
ncbi:MAG: hypothetical protein L6R36_007039 [Xanthoria steineri]|nr:MAG: hypothetical protein L6R36_007039 [Xanthoria steineri]